jgi:hypothetical protein
VRLTFSYDNRELDSVRAFCPKAVSTITTPDYVTVRFQPDKYQFPEVEVAMSHDVARLLYKQLKPTFEG